MARQRCNKSGCRKHGRPVWFRLPKNSPPSSGDFLLLENGDNLLLENGDKFLIQ